MRIMRMQCACQKARFFLYWKSTRKITSIQLGPIVNIKGSPYSITERRVPGWIPVLGSQPGGDVSHEPGVRLPLLSAVTPATLKRDATNFAAW